MNIFEILGPTMVGPSSSHTAGAVRIGLMTRKLLGETPASAHIILHGSFATTGEGHGTDKALIAGLLGMQPDDMRIPKSFTLAGEKGLSFSFSKETLRDAHPNTAVLEVEDHAGHRLKIQASSLGGGRILINKIDDIQVNFSGEKPTLIVQNLDEPGRLAKIAEALYFAHINIATLQLYRSTRGGYAFTIAETDNEIPSASIDALKKEPGILKVTYIHG